MLGGLKVGLHGLNDKAAKIKILSQMARNAGRYMQFSLCQVMCGPKHVHIHAGGQDRFKKKTESMAPSFHHCLVRCCDFQSPPQTWLVTNTLETPGIMILLQGTNSNVTNNEEITSSTLPPQICSQAFFATNAWLAPTQFCNSSNSSSPRSFQTLGEVMLPDLSQNRSDNGRIWEGGDWKIT